MCKVTGYVPSVVNVESSNLYVGSSPRIFFLSICTDEFKSAPKIMAFFLMFPSVNENSKWESNPIS